MATKQPLRDEARAQLAAAIDEHRAAQSDVENARTAADRAMDKAIEARREVERLEAELAETDAGAAGRVVATMLSGGDVAELDRPLAELRDKLANARHELESWRNAASLARGLIQTREAECEKTARKLDLAAKRVLTQSLDIPGMVAELAELQTRLCAKRMFMLALRELLSEEARDAILQFTNIPFLSDEMNQLWRNNLEVAPYRQAFDKLHNDADALAPVAEG